MAHKMNFKVVAEGVEDLECLTLLQKFDCDVAQGWHIGKPINSEMFEQQWNTKDIAKSA
jgi:EAL domain-containing protein (putative c-di-GMP-specific phosphodiesterase class I)